MRLKTIRRKQNLVNAYPKRKLGVAMNFSDIHVIKLQFRKKMTHIALYFGTNFRNIVALFSLKNVWLPPILFVDSSSPC